MPPDFSTPSILLLAETQHVRDSLHAEISRFLPDAVLCIATDLDEVLARSASADGVPTLVVLAANTSSSWSQTELADLWNRLPLARWIVVHDGLTASALRHDSRFPAACCVPRERLLPRLQREMAILAGRGEPLPLTAGLDEVFVWEAALQRDHDLHGLRVALFTADRHLRDWWEQLIEAFRGCCVSLEQAPAAVLWDLDPAIPERESHLRMFRPRDRDCLIIGFRNTVNDRTRAAAEALGIDLLLPKLLSGEMIVAALNGVPSLPLDAH